MRQQSRLDCLWANFGQYSVSNTLQPNSIPTTELLLNLANNLKNDVVGSVKLEGNVLVGSSVSGNLLFNIDVSLITSTGNTLIDFGKRYITAEDIKNGILLPENTLVYYLKFSDGSELVTEIDSYSYEGLESNTNTVTVSNNLILVETKIDNSGSLVMLSETERGLKATLDESKLTDKINLLTSNLATIEYVDSKLAWKSI